MQEKTKSGNQTRPGSKGRRQAGCFPELVERIENLLTVLQTAYSDIDLPQSFESGVELHRRSEPQVV